MDLDTHAEHGFVSENVASARQSVKREKSLQYGECGPNGRRLWDFHVRQSGRAAGQ